MHESILDLIGNTPLVRLTGGLEENAPKAYAKLEFLNPTGSVKDRMAYHIINKAVQEGRLKPGDTIIDNTSGNTGSSLGMVATLFGLKAVVTTPEKTSQEKVDLIKSYGVEVIITPTEAAHEDPKGCFMLARSLAKENGWFDLNQYDNAENIESHYFTTGPEIWKQTEETITHFVCGIGTGGTFSGTARYLKEVSPTIKCIAVDPVGSIFADFINEQKLIKGHTYKVEGIGSDVITKALDTSVVDEVITVSDEDAFNRARLVTRVDGICAGGSSGAVACAMEQVAKTALSDSVIVGIFADAGIRYMSKCYNDAWMHKHGYTLQTESD
ncbi:MAG: cysteine synthase family protein [bacterium]|nr:cysteine synthase family protein [bacterium]